MSEELGKVLRMLDRRRGQHGFAIDRDGSFRWHGPGETDPRAEMDANFDALLAEAEAEETEMAQRRGFRERTGARLTHRLPAVLRAIIEHALAPTEATRAELERLHGEMSRLERDERP